ncbi:MAG: hypothetical protein IMW98_06080 [Firmicutes bacterium]|nr:hypothetical protein [Bacillota bacterium]
MVDPRTAIVPAIMFIVWAAVQAGLPRKLAPTLALALGVVLGVWFTPGNLGQGVIFGILSGAAAVGFHSGTKNTIQALRGQ